MTLAPAIGQLGAPGILVAPPSLVGSITRVRRDVPAFFGVAPRGPCREPSPTLAPDDRITSWLVAEPIRRTFAIPITSWDEYRHHFGGFEGPGRLPYAVSAFFAAGGERAFVARVVHEYNDALLNSADVAAGTFDGLTKTGGDPVVLFARSEGEWGNALQVTLRFRIRPLVTRELTVSKVVVDQQEWVPTGSLLRLRLPGDIEELRFVELSEELPDQPIDRRHLTVDMATSAVPISAEVVTGTIEVVDLDPRFARREIIDDLGFDSAHPRWMARALINESMFVWPDSQWVDSRLVVGDPRLAPVQVTADDKHSFANGEDRWNTITPEDYWDATWTPGDEVAGDGVQCLGNNDDVGLLVAPDLYEPAPLAPLDEEDEPATLCGPEFAKHVELPKVASVAEAPPGLDGLSLDPLDAMDRARIIANQRELVNYADSRRDLTVLLDVPLGVSHRQALEWRNEFDSPYAAAYHPWLDVSAPDDGRDTLVPINPSAFAAGIIAEREKRLGVHYGPANQIAVDAVRVDKVVPPERHDELHLAGINVFQLERDGIRLAGARTLALRSLVRQLSVVRLVTVLRLSLQREMQWAVFEPNNDALWADVRRLLTSFLMKLYEAGAFRGARPSDAFFVRCDRTTMTTNDLDNGRMICLVGVNVAEPVEYIVLEIALDSDSTIQANLVGA